MRHVVLTNSLARKSPKHAAACRSPLSLLLQLLRRPLTQHPHSLLLL
jgi:hypothetical protein